MEFSAGYLTLSHILQNDSKYTDFLRSLLETCCICQKLCRSPSLFVVRCPRSSHLIITCPLTYHPRQPNTSACKKQTIPMSFLSSISPPSWDACRQNTIFLCLQNLVQGSFSRHSQSHLSNCQFVFNQPRLFHICHCIFAVLCVIIVEKCLPS